MFSVAPYLCLCKINLIKKHIWVNKRLYLVNKKRFSQRIHYRLQLTLFLADRANRKVSDVITETAEYSREKWKQNVNWNFHSIYLYASISSRMIIRIWWRTIIFLIRRMMLNTFAKQNKLLLWYQWLKGVSLCRICTNNFKTIICCRLFSCPHKKIAMQTNNRFCGTISISHSNCGQ